MKPNLPGRRALAISTVLVVAACGDPDRTVTAPTDRAPALARGAPQPSIGLAMTVLDGGSYKIQSDGLGEYRNGVHGMQVEIDGAGNFQISPLNANSATPPQRTLRFDYSEPIDPLNLYRPNVSGQWNFKIKTGTNATGAPRIQDLGISGNPAAWCYLSTIAHSTSVTGFQDDFGYLADPQSTHLYITRTNVPPAPSTWTVVTDGCGVNPNSAALYSQERLTKTKSGPLIWRGYYNQQFALQLRTYP